MRVVIAGPRYANGTPGYKLVCRATRDSGWNISTVISGCARGIDTHAITWAKFRGIPVVEFPVTNEQWKMYPKRAGFMRNERMAKAADAAIVIWDGEARGSQNMIQQATNADILLYVYMFDKKKFLVELEKQMPVKEWKGL